MDNLNDKQLEAVSHGKGPLLIAAGAGSGKTKTLVNRLLHLLKSGVPAEKIIAITFTNKAANEMRSRISNLKFEYQNSKQIQKLTVSPMNNSNDQISKPVSDLEFSASDFPFVGTFHSFGVKILKNEAPYFHRTKNFTIFDYDDSLSLIKKILKEKDLLKERYNPIAILGKISNLKSELYPVRNSPPIGPSGALRAGVISNGVNKIEEPGNAYEEKVLTIYEEYKSVLQKSNAFDFDDLITKVVKIFNEQPEILTKYQDQYEYILVDEYQDINTAQYQLIKLLALKHQNIFAIGDDAQSIYKFRGSDFRNFLNFEKEWPKAKIIKLEQNYRSTSIIVSASSAIIKNNKQQKPKELWTKNLEGDLIKITAYQSAEEEAWGICEKIVEQLKNTSTPKNKITNVFLDEPEVKHEPVNPVRSRSPLGPVRDKLPWATASEKRISNGASDCSTAFSEAASNGVKIGEIAILYRTNAQSRAIEQALIQSKIPYEIYGGLKFYARKEIKDLIAGLRYAYNPKDAASIERINKNFTKTKSKVIFENLPELTKELTLVQIISYFMKSTDYAEYLVKNFKNPSERMENVKELINFASKYEDPYKFLEEVSLMSATDGKPKLLKDSVKLMTVHAAKGLEFDNVFLAGCNEGFMPHEQSFYKADEIEEERRLMYVAMTRARKKLFISFYNLPSRFLGELPGDLIEFVKVSSYGEREMDWGDETIYIE